MKRFITWALAASLTSVVGCTVYEGNYDRGYHYDDSNISGAVESRLYSEGFRDVGVETVDGTVYLEGMVPSPNARQRASYIATRTTGVNRVVNNLQIGIRAGDAPDDDYYRWEHQHRHRNYRNPGGTLNRH